MAPFTPVSGLGYVPQGMGSVQSLWDAFTSFWDTTVSTSDWVKGNVGTTETQPDYQVPMPKGPVVPQGALDPNKGYHPYATDYTWCSPTDTDCLNGITNQPDKNLEDARKNIQNIATGNLDAIKSAEDAAAAAKKKSDQQMLLIAAGLAVLVLVTRK